MRIGTRLGHETSHARPHSSPRFSRSSRYRYKGALCVAYIDDVEGKKKTNLPTEAAPEKTFYSCLIDGTQRDGNGRLKKDAEGRLAPTYIIELPGVPILGNGKSDNQNCALPFTRGPILQAIDCNQEGYLEEAFKLPCALREFEFTNRAADTPKPPAIVGFREHIFSGIGLLGDLAASSELCFGTLVQRTMADPLWCRYHYGHPDMLDKLALLAQVTGHYLLLRLLHHHLLQSLLSHLLSHLLSTPRHSRRAASPKRRRT